MELISTALRADSTVAPAERLKLLALLRKGKDVPAKARNPISPQLPSIVRPAQAAVRLGRTVRSVHRFCREGLLVKVKFPNHKRAAGITEESLAALIHASTGDAK